jgi:hypothetical protein
MRYLKLFESVDKLYKKMTTTEYIEYFSSHTVDNNNSSLIGIVKSYIPRAKISIEGKVVTVELNPHFFSSDHYYYHFDSNDYSRVTAIKNINLILFNDEYIIIYMSLEAFNVNDINFLCDGYDGLEQFFKEIVK